MTRAIQGLLVLALFMVLGACASAPCKNCHSAAGGVPAIQPPAPCGDDMDLASADMLTKTVTDKKSVDVLLLSGGGSRGSFSAGILQGWGASRPDFEMVTGVSVGAILATWAYLGPGDHGGDPYALMKESFGGGLDSSKIIKRRWLFPLVDSIYSLSPMKQTFRQVLPTKMILEVGRVYEDTGRQLWIGTTNLESGQFCQWNLGKLALTAVKVEKDTTIDDDDKTKRIADIVDRYYDLVIASSANPTVFKSVKIDGAIHVDGGVSHTIFTTRLADIIKSVVDKKPDLVNKEFNVYAVVNGRLITSQQCPASNVLGLATRSISILSKSAERANLDRIKVMVDDALGNRPWTYRTAWLDASIHLDPADVFTKKGMGDLHQRGVDWISQRDRWCVGGPQSTVEPEDSCYLPTTYGTACD